MAHHSMGPSPENKPRDSENLADARVPVPHEHEIPFERSSHRILGALSKKLIEILNDPTFRSARHEPLLQILRDAAGGDDSQWNRVREWARRVPLPVEHAASRDSDYALRLAAYAVFRLADRQGVSEEHRAAALTTFYRAFALGFLQEPPPTLKLPAEVASYLVSLHLLGWISRATGWLGCIPELLRTLPKVPLVGGLLYSDCVAIAADALHRGCAAPDASPLVGGPLARKALLDGLGASARALLKDREFDLAYRTFFVLATCGSEGVAQFNRSMSFLSGYTTDERDLGNWSLNDLSTASAAMLQPLLDLDPEVFAPFIRDKLPTRGPENIFDRLAALPAELTVEGKDLMLQVLSKHGHRDAQVKAIFRALSQQLDQGGIGEPLEAMLRTRIDEFNERTAGP